jgi:hypothetical protein
MSLFRERLLRRLVEAHAISPELVKKLLAWRRPGFSAHVGERIAPTDRRRLEDTAAYLVRNPLSLKKLVYLDGQQAVLYRSRMNPSLGRNFDALDPLMCARCGQRMSLIAFVTDQLAIGKILDHLGLSSPRRQSRPRPCARSSASPSTATAGACRPSGSEPQLPRWPGASSVTAAGLRAQRRLPNHLRRPRKIRYGRPKRRCPPAEALPDTPSAASHLPGAPIASKARITAPWSPIESSMG